jgi:predicted metal-binding protein
VESGGSTARPELHVCITCRMGRDLVPGEDCAGRRLHGAVADSLARHPQPPVVLREVTCFAACQRGCAVAISAPGKWTYLLGGLEAGLAEDLLAYGATYAASASGAVLPSRRPESLRAAVIGRIPSFVSQEPPA